jgi:hypothetical protein
VLVQPTTNQELTGTQTASLRQMPYTPFPRWHGALSATLKEQAPETQPFTVKQSVEVQSVETQQSI